MGGYPTCCKPNPSAFQDILDERKDGTMVDGTEQAKAFEERTGLGAFAPTHISHKRVEAYPIAAAEFEADGSGRVGVNDPARGYVVVPVPAGFLRRPGAVTEGDMLVRYEPTTEEPNGYLSHSPRTVFEAGYQRVLADVEIATGAPILTLAEAQSVVATKTAPRITEDLMREQIATVEYARLRHLTICVITLKNGFFSDGMSAPADPANYDPAVGERYAFDNAFRKLWPMFGFLLRDRLSGGDTLAGVPGLQRTIRLKGATSVTLDQPADAA